MLSPIGGKAAEKEDATEEEAITVLKKTFRDLRFAVQQYHYSVLLSRARCLVDNLQAACHAHGGDPGPTVAECQEKLEELQRKKEAEDEEEHEGYEDLTSTNKRKLAQKALADLLDIEVERSHFMYTLRQADEKGDLCAVRKTVDVLKSVIRRQDELPWPENIKIVSHAIDFMGADEEKCLLNISNDSIRGKLEGDDWEYYEDDNPELFASERYGYSEPETHSLHGDRFYTTDPIQFPPPPGYTFDYRCQVLCECTRCPPQPPPYEYAYLKRFS